MARGSAKLPSGPERASSKDVQVLRRLLPYLRPHAMRVVLTVIALVVAAATVLSLGQGLRILVDEGFATGGNPAALDWALLGLLTAVVVLAGATYARFYLVSWLGERVVADLRRDVFGHVLGLSPSWFETTRLGEVISRLTADVTVVQTVVGSSASIFLRNLVLLAGGLIMMAVTSLKLTGLVALIIPLVVVPILTFGRKVRRLSRESQDRVADVSVRVEESLGAVQTVQSFAQEAREEREFTARVEDAFDAARRRIQARALLTASVILLVFGAIGGVLWIGGQDVLAGRLSAGALSSFIFFAIVTAGAAGAISEVIGEIQRAAGATERLFDLLDQVPEIASPAKPTPLPSPVAGRLSFEEVTFHYPSRPETAALRSFSIAVTPGETLALVGPSGAGKSTLFALLARFYAPQSGRITLEGIPITDLEPGSLRKSLSLVPQDPVMFSATARENILYGRPDASPEALDAAIVAANAKGFLEALPEGLDTPLGEKGVRLSGGQRQRIAIARALLADAPVLLLDEATSSLDSESERAVQTALETLMRGRTTLVIAHRLATVQAADRIAVLDQGRLVETGSHAELSARGGLYAKLAALQFDLLNGPAS